MIIIVIVALLLVAMAIYSPLLNERSRNMLYAFAAVVLILVVVLRHYDCNRDFFVYHQLYDMAPPMSMLKSSLSEYNANIITEFSFSSLCTFLKDTGNSDKMNFIIIFAIYALLGVSINLYAIKKLSDLEFFALFIYYSNMFFLHEMTQVRAGVAIGLMLLGVAALRDEKYLKFVLYILIGSFFHTSALMGFVLLVFRKMRASATVWGVAFLLCVIVHLTHYDILNIINIIPIEFYQYKLKRYILLQDREGFEINYLNFSFLVQMMVLVLCFFYQEKLEKEDKHVNILLNMVAFSSCCYLFFGQIPGFAVRISELYNSGLVVLLPLIIKVMNPKALSQSLVIVIGSLLFFINAFRSEIMMYGYKFIFE